MLRKPAFWIAFGLLDLVLLGFCAWLLPRTFPLITVDITMGRETAVQQARALAVEHGWGPGGDVRTAVSFVSDNTVQSFVELEGGGAEAFTKLVDDGFYTPYRWRVRLFREGEADVTNVYFAPDGTPVAFAEAVPEAAERPNLTADAARALAPTKEADRG